MTNSERPKDLITVNEARKMLGVGPVKMAKLIKQDVLEHYENPLDGRVKFVSKAAVLALIPDRAEAA